jgi:hypothetical protein
MRQFLIRFGRPRHAAAQNLEALFGVEGLVRARRSRMRSLLADDMSIGEQFVVALEFAALGLAPPALFGVALFLWLWAQGGW